LAETVAQHSNGCTESSCSVRFRCNHLNQGWAINLAWELLWEGRDQRRAI